MVEREAFKPRQAICSSTVFILLIGIVEVYLGMIAPAQAQDSELPEAYWEAVEDARTPEPAEVFNQLTAITPHNSTIARDEDGRVLVTTWTTWNGYAQNVGDRLILTRDVWVTAFPDLQNFCRNYIPTAEISLSARLNQLLGLPPEAPESAANRQVVEIWVDPQFLFRPSPDPEITDSEAELSFRTPNEFVFVSPRYQHWFYQQFDQRYQSNGQPIANNSLETSGTLPYPWTQLGYTYDWGDPSDWATIDPDRPENVGLSEFVIRQWSPISVNATWSVEDYCQ